MCPQCTSEFLVVATARQEALSATREKLALLEPRSKTLQAELDASRRENAKLLERCADLERAAKQGRALPENGSKHAEQLATLNESCAALRAQVPTESLVCLRTARPRMRNLTDVLTARSRFVFAFSLTYNFPVIMARNSSAR